MLGKQGIAWLPSSAGDKLIVEIGPSENAREPLTTVVYPLGELTEGQSRSDFDADWILDAIMESIAPPTWQPVGGSGTLSLPLGARALCVSQTWPVHVQIYEFLEDCHRIQLAEARRRRNPTHAVRSGYDALERIDEQASPYDYWQRFLRLRRKLNSPLAPPWQFADTPLPEAIATIEQSEGIDIYLDREAAKSAGRVTCSLAKKTFGAALTELLQPLGLAFAPRALFRRDARPAYRPIFDASHHGATRNHHPADRGRAC